MQPVIGQAIGIRQRAQLGKQAIHMRTRFLCSCGQSGARCGMIISKRIGAGLAMRLDLATELNEDEVLDDVQVKANAALRAFSCIEGFEDARQIFSRDAISIIDEADRNRRPIRNRARRNPRQARPATRPARTES